MSLVNQMLRDLDERHATANERAGLAAHVRALPPERRLPWARLVPMAVGIAVGAAGLWLALDARRQPPVEAKEAVGAQPAAPVAMALPALMVPMPNDSGLGGEGVAPATAAPSAPSAPSAPAKPDGGAAESLQIDFRLSQPVRARSQPVVAAAPQAIDKRQAEPAPETAEGEYRRAMAAHRQGRTSEALAGFEAAVRLDARHASARQALLSLLMEQRRWPEAQTAAADGLALDAAQAGWAMILARLQVEQGQLVEAEQTMARHAGGGERSPDYLAFHALLLQKLQRPREAAERYLAAASLRPNEGRWWYGLGMALEADQRPQEARDAFRRARETGNLPAELDATVDRRLR